MKKCTLILLALILCCLNIAAVCAEATSIDVYFNDPYNNQKDRTIQNMILDDIKGAKERIDLATYNYTDTKTAEALVKAAKRGVQVNLVIDEENFNKDVVKDMIAGGVNVVKAESEGLMHAKYIIIDGKITISGSANMTVSSYSYDNNFMIRIVSEKVADLFTEEFDEMFIDHIFGQESAYTPKPTAGVTLDDGTVVYVRFSPDDQIDDLIETLISAADESVYMLAYSFASKDIAQRLYQADKDGLDVVVICEDSKAYTDGGGQCGPLAEKGVDVFVDGYSDTLMHEKAIILDQSVTIAGSFNFTRSADKRNDEQILVIQSEDIAAQFLDEFNKILAGAK